MTGTDRLLIIRRIRHNDHTYILNTLSESRGKESFVIRTGKSAEGKRKRLLAVPLQWVEAEWIRTRTELPLIKTVRALYVYQSLPADLRKTAQALFMAETLHQILEQESNPGLFQRIFGMYKKLDTEDYFPDFHLVFLWELSRVLGFGPQNDRKGTFFDMENGKFTDMAGPSTLSRDQSALLALFLERGHLASGRQRASVLGIWEQYFQWHTGKYRLPKSVEIYREILAG